ncbi:C-X-C motif chemokine 11 [Pygocentrus nattereri]|uniref:C-X-C motif chemokine 11 n=1 Tax=Pygocentrus nattereri TaxID=42514 RepID=UPI00081468E5|nr:C-X-C motif chemokine 11 [Pygocentrus nattereri]
MKSTLHTLSALLAVGLYILLTAQVGDSQHVPTRCECQKSMRAVRGPFSDIKVSLKGHGCDKDEIIVTLKSNNKQMCLSPKERQGKRLLKCWLKMQKKGEDVKKCIQRLRPQKRRRQKKRT